MANPHHQASIATDPARGIAPGTEDPWFTEFALTQTAPLTQQALRNPNPLCGLAALTLWGTLVCERGCGMHAATPDATHICPFGMMMHRAPDSRNGLARWVGRRFPSHEALRTGLNRLVSDGLDRDALLAHLPPNPVASPEELAEAAGARQAQPEPDREAPPEEPSAVLAEALRAELGRAMRHHEPFALLCLRAVGLAGEPPLPTARLTLGFARVIRPYDVLAGSAVSPNTWFLVLADARETAARGVATRLLNVFEDVMDAAGGMEELGVRMGIGISLWGLDAVSTGEMVAHAVEAAGCALRENEPVVLCEIDSMAEAR